MSMKCDVKGCRKQYTGTRNGKQYCEDHLMNAESVQTNAVASDPQTRVESGAGADTPPDAVLAALARQWKAEADAKAITSAHRDLVKEAKKAVRDAYREWREGQGQIGWDEVPSK